MNGATWDRTRWDRLQCVALLLGIAVVTALPLWLVVLARLAVNP